MKKLFSVILISLFVLSVISAKDVSITKSLSMREIDKIEISNCTRYPDLKGYIAAGPDKAAGFYLKQTGDKYTMSVGDWKNPGGMITIILFDIDYSFEYRMHSDGDDLYIAIVEPVKE